MLWAVAVVVGGIWLVQCSSPRPTGSTDVRPTAAATLAPLAPTTEQTPAPTPTSSEPLAFETSSGLACATEQWADTIHEPNFAADGGEEEGFATFEEAVSDWWNSNMPNHYRRAEDHLFQDAIGDSAKVAFRNKDGHARLQLYGKQESNGLWNISRTESCHAP